jgi:two-component system, LytTR family, response regulator
MDVIRCIIVDDEPLARERLRMLLSETEQPVEVAGEAGGGQEAVALIHALEPDLVFLDVQMPVLDGFDVVDLLPPPRPHVVFVTAFDEHAVRAFEVHALDYLTKPVRLDRLNRTLQRIGAGADGRSGEGVENLRRARAGLPLTRLTVHSGRRLRLVSLEDVRWIEAREKLVYVQLEDGAFMTDFTLDELEARLSPDRFLRIHRSVIANADRIRELIPWDAGMYAAKMEDGTTLPIARRRTREVMERLGR